MAQNSSNRYAVLDLLRGVAAIGVMLLHFGSVAHAPIIVLHGYLAVDFFFILSGVVISHAYADRIHSLGFSRFLELRVKRLLPMSMFGVLLGTAYLAIKSHLQPGLSDGPVRMLAASGFNLFLIPKPWTGRWTGHAMYPADLVLWSVLLEILINVAWAACWIRRKNLVLIGISAIGYLVFAISARHFGTSSLGWNWSTLIGGFGRVTFGFFVGVLIWRLRPQIRISPVLAGWLSSAILASILCLPSCPWWADVLVVTFILPCLVYFAAGIATPGESKTSSLLGNLSYPLYAIHWPIIGALALLLGWDRPEASKIGPQYYALCIPIVAVAYLLDRFYDAPIRLWLARLGPGSRSDRRTSSTEMVTGSLEDSTQKVEQSSLGDVFYERVIR